MLGRDFAYAPSGWGGKADGYSVWETVPRGGVASHPAFGGAETVYNVIDTRQSYLQRVVAQGLRSLGHDDHADRSVHFCYEMVALSPAAVLTLFPEYVLSDDEKAKPYLEMSGRKGLGVRADDLLDALERRAAEEVRKRNPTFDDARIRETARRVAVGSGYGYRASVLLLDISRFLNDAGLHAPAKEVLDDGRLQECQRFVSFFGTHLRRPWSCRRLQRRVDPLRLCLFQ